MQFHTQKHAPAQKKDAPTAASVLDSSSQSESLQRKADMANNAVQRAEAPRPNKTGMPDNLKSGIENLSGFSMDDVRVHYNSSKPATVQALAYTQGTDIHVAPGQEKHLPHEAWHVAQQMAGRVSPTTNINGMLVNDNAALEHEADVMGAKAVQMKLDECKTVQRATIWNGVVQRTIDPNEYYYHLSSGGIDGEIDPMYILNNGLRGTRGDDLGPGFYMGDYNCLKHYYKANPIMEDSFHIYYIKKNELPENLGIKDFTKGIEKGIEKVTPEKLFQIAMELGFDCVNGGCFRPLDLLAPDLQKLAPDLPNTEIFKNYVQEKYPTEASALIAFFMEAEDKDIWMGYLNDTTEKRPKDKYQYVQSKEGDKDVKPIQIAIRKKDKINGLLIKMRTLNHIIFSKVIEGKDTVEFEPKSEEGKELKGMLRPCFSGYI